MPKKRTVAPRMCRVLWEGATPAADTSAAPWGLPSSFPLHCLDDDQAGAVVEWWDAWACDILAAVKRALGMPYSYAKKETAEQPVTLQNYIVHAVVLAHLLRLHPSAEESLPKLAKELGVAERRLYYARDAILEKFGKDVVAAFRASHEARSEAQDRLTQHPGLNYAAAVKLKGGVYAIPYAENVRRMAHRFAIVQQVADFPGVDTVRDDFMPDGATHCIRICLKH